MTLCYPAFYRSGSQLTVSAGQETGSVAIALGRTTSLPVVLSEVMVATQEEKTIEFRAEYESECHTAFYQLQ